MHHADCVFGAYRDRVINPDLERIMTARAKLETIELPGSHATVRSHPKEVAALNESGKGGGVTRQNEAPKYVFDRAIR